jgi:hypothetical protein
MDPDASSNFVHNLDRPRLARRALIALLTASRISGQGLVNWTEVRGQNLDEK